jgi:hypothetical protein
MFPHAYRDHDGKVDEGRLGSTFGVVRAEAANFMLDRNTGVAG